MDEKITIIEGPTPDFEHISDGWALGIDQSSDPFDLAITRLRTFNGPALVERCHRAWARQGNIFLHYRNRIGMEERAPIVAARNLETGEGHVLLLWCRFPSGDAASETPDDDQDGMEN